MTSKKQWTGERWETDVQNETAIEHLHRYALAMELSAGKTVLDIACGEGYGSRLLASNAAAVTGVDTDETTILQAKEKYEAANIQFLTADARATTLPGGSFDLIVSFETLEHLTEHDLLFTEFKRLLRQNGQLIISTPDREQYSVKPGYINPFHKKELSQPEFEALLQKYFKQVMILTQKTCHSSLIISTGQYRFDQYTGNHMHLEKNAAGEGLYLIAIASDEPLPEVNNSIFNAKSILQAAIEKQEKLVQQTLTYHVGHILLSPLKWVKKLFQ